MKHLKGILVIAAIIAAAASCTRFESVKGDPMNAKIYTLQNGLQIYMTVNRDQPRIQTYIAVKAGGKNGPDESTGLAHYFEHLMFKGTEQFGTSDYSAEKPLLDSIELLFEEYRRTTGEAERNAIYHRIDSISYLASSLSIPNEYDKLMSMIGADGTNAWTSMDETVYQEEIPSNQIDNWARIQADRFRNVVLRGFHTELETIYEEKNMSLTQDSRKIWETLDAGLFPNHPYGKRTVLGTQEHLKNPSITNVKRFHDDYYVPNNIRICLSGDFDPEEMVKTIEKYFGDWEPNSNIPVLEFEPEAPITEPVVKEVFGLEAESMAMGWRLPSVISDLKTYAVADIAGSVLYNGKTGLLDLDVIQKQRALSMYGGYSPQPDYSSFIFMATPKEGQSLEQLRDIVLEEISKLRGGDFDAGMLEAIINNKKLRQMRSLENNSERASMFVDSFIYGIEWKDYCRQIETLSSVTKEDVVAFANEYLRDNSFVVVYKRQGEDRNIQKISAPSITPIQTNRDNQSAFLKEIQKTEVKPIDPVFVDFDKDMTVCDFCNGVRLLYKHNDINGAGLINISFNEGTESVPCLSLASDYLDYLGTEDMSAEEFATKMYSLACNSWISTGATTTTIAISGLDENLPEALALVEKRIEGALGDEAILSGLKKDLLKNRIDTKKNQRSCFNALRRYSVYGPEFIKKTTLSNEDVASITGEQLLGALRDVFSKGHDFMYYGSRTKDECISTFKDVHKVNEGCVKTARKHPEMQLTPSNRVILAQYDAKQLYYYQYSNRGEKFDLAATPAISLYNEYFGGGMNTIVFQEMREARGLAYSAWANLSTPEFKDNSYAYSAFIATQNDKLRQAVEAFDMIINDMPQSDAAFGVAKEAILGRIRTQRYTGINVLGAFQECENLGIDEPFDRIIFEKVQDMTLEDVTAAQKQWVKGRNYTYDILGDIKDLDMDFLKTLGPVKVVSLEDIFGY